MRALLAYWIVSCIIIGAAEGAHQNKCPNDKMFASGPGELLAWVAAWPVALGAALVANKREAPACTVTTP